MGSAVSLSGDTEITIEKAKELLNDKYNNEIEIKLNEIISKTSTPLTLNIIKQQFPELFETNEEKIIRLKKEYEIKLKERSEGEVIINYQLYNERFQIMGNSLTAEKINDEYCLYDVMPGCEIKLSEINSNLRTEYSNKHNGLEAPWIKEEPKGVYHDLLAGETYYCIVIENPEQYKRDMEELTNRLRLEGNEIVQEKRAEGCSCLYGNPCVDQYICRDWNNCFAVAKKNGWKGF